MNPKSGSFHLCYLLLIALACALMAACVAETNEPAEPTTFSEPESVKLSAPPPPSSFSAENGSSALNWPPHYDEACFGCNVNPNCVWICPWGAEYGTANVANEAACKAACKRSCAAAGQYGAICPLN